MDTLLASVSQLVEDRRFGEVAEALDTAELEEPSALSSEQWPHALHLLAHVYASRLEDARFLYKRTPDSIKQGSPELQAAFGLLQRLWIKDYPNTWTALQFGWSPQVAPLVQALAEQLRQRMLDLVGRAYSNLSAAKLSVLLGCSEAEAAQAAAGQGWEVDGGGFVDVKQQVAAAEARAAEAEAAAQRSLERLSEYVVHLEA